MSGITVAEYGFGFAAAHLKAYLGTIWLAAFFLLGLVYVLLLERRQKNMLFFWYLLTLLLTVYNPLLVRFVIPALKMEMEYYRFFWLFPLVPGAACFMVKLAYAPKKRPLRIAAAALICAGIVLLGTPIDGIVTNFRKIENPYKIPSELGAICTMVHEDSAKKQPSVLFPHELNITARQYDPSVLLPLRRDTMEVYLGNPSLSVGNSYYKICEYRILDVMYSDQVVRRPKFLRALSFLKADYICLPKAVSDFRRNLLKGSGLEKVNSTENYVIWKYGDKAKKQCAALTIPDEEMSTVEEMEDF